MSRKNATVKRIDALNNKARPAKSKALAEKKIPDFCKNVRSKRYELGLSQRALAEKINVSYPRIAELESGRFPEDPSRIIAISQALGVTIDWLFTNGREEP